MSKGGPPPICNGRNGEAGVDCRVGRPTHIDQRKTVTPREEPAKKKPKALMQADPAPEDKPKTVVAPPMDDGFYNNPTWTRLGGAPGDMRKTKNIRGYSSLADASGVEDGFYNNPNFKRLGGDEGSMENTANVRGTSSFTSITTPPMTTLIQKPCLQEGAETRGQAGVPGFDCTDQSEKFWEHSNYPPFHQKRSLVQAPPPKGTKDEIQKFVKPCTAKYEGNDCQKTGGKYWEHNNDVPIHGKASLSQYDTWKVTNSSKETDAIKACLTKGNCPDKAWEHDLGYNRYTPSAAQIGDIPVFSGSDEEGRRDTTHTG
jgi:hypothetical protein